MFAYAGTLSLAKELTSVPVTSMQIGDVLIQGGSPGTRSSWSIWQRIPATGEKLYLLAQSYMPAQDIQVLVNLKERDKSPWYTLKGEGSIFDSGMGIYFSGLETLLKIRTVIFLRKPLIRKVKNHSESDRQDPFPGDVQ